MTENILNVISALYASTASEQPWSDVLGMICASFRAQGAWLTDPGPGAPLPAIRAYWKFDPVQLENHLRGNDAADGGHRRTKSSSRSSQTPPDRGFLIKNHNNGESLNVVSFGDERKSTSFGIAFAANASASTETIAPDLQRVYDHLRRAVEIRNYVSIQAQRSNGILDSVAIPFLLLQHDREILYSNRAATETLRDQDVLFMSQNRLAATDPRLHSLLQEKVESIASGTAARPSAALPLGEAGKNAILHLKSWDDHRRRQVMAAIKPAALVKPHDLPVLREAFGLSEVESQIVALVLQNESPRTIAERRQISEQTVRWHLKNIYSKTGTRGFRDLILTVLAAARPFL